MTRSFAALLLTLSGVLSPLWAQSHAGTCKELRPSMQIAHIPDLALAVFASGSVDMSFCSLQAGGLSPNAVFEAASLSKPVFAAAVLTLVKEKRLDLDVPLATYLSGPYQHSRDPFDPAAAVDRETDTRFNRITARMVLDHTSGLPNWAHTGPLTFRSDPGSTWSYSGEAYVFLQRVVEKITGQPTEAFVASRILGPLRMTHSSFVWKNDYAGTCLHGHSTTGETLPLHRYAQAVASSTLYTTLGDYSLFVRALLDQPMHSIYGDEGRAQVAVREDLQLAWALGVAVETSSGSVFHWGANPGFQSMFFITPATGRGVLFLTDSDAGLELVDPLVSKYDPGAHASLRFPMLHPKD